MKILVLPLPVCATIVAVSLIAPWTLTAQTISGQVTDSVTGTGVARGFVVLVNDRGQDVARTLAGEHGRFVISARAAGKYRVRSERIGYRMWESELIELRANRAFALSRSGGCSGRSFLYSGGGWGGWGGAGAAASRRGPEDWRESGHASQTAAKTAVGTVGDGDLQ